MKDRIGESIKLIPQDFKMFLLLDEEWCIQGFVDMLVDIRAGSFVKAIKEEQFGNAGFVIKRIFINDKRAEVERQLGFILFNDQYRVAVEGFFFDFRAGIILLQPVVPLLP